MSSERSNVVLLGASGTLGGFIAELISELADKINLIVAMRHPPKEGSELSSFEYRHLDLAKPATFEAVLKDADILIHAAGPFTHDPAPLVQACLSTATHYIDIAEDPGFINRIHETVSKFSNPSSFVAPGCSTIPGLVELLAQRFAGIESLNKINIYLNMGSSNPVSLGLFRSLLEPIGRNIGDSLLCFRRLHKRRHRDELSRGYGDYPLPFRGGLAISGKQVKGHFYAGFDRLYINVSLVMASYLLPYFSNNALTLLAKSLLPIANLFRYFGGSEGRLVVEACNKEGNILAQWEIIAKDRGLYLPAAPAVWVMAALLHRKSEHYTHASSGLQNLGDLISIPSVIEWLELHGYEIEYSLSEDLTAC